jgi:hypothetical protein
VKKIFSPSTSIFEWSCQISPIYFIKPTKRKTRRRIPGCGDNRPKYLWARSTTELACDSPPGKSLQNVNFRKAAFL